MQFGSVIVGDVGSTRMCEGYYLLVEIRLGKKRGFGLPFWREALYHLNGVMS